MIDPTPEQLAVFVQEYIKREHQPDAAVLAVIAADMRDPAWLPEHVAEFFLGRPEIQGAIKAVKVFYKPQGVTPVTQDTLIADAETIFQDARNAREFPAAVSAKKFQAELLGLLKKDITINVKHTVTTMNDAELEAIAKRGVIDAEFTEVGGVPAVIDGP